MKGGREEPKCGTCAFWQVNPTDTQEKRGDSAGGRGWCKRYPPPPNPERELDKWPYVPEGEWCGEYKAGRYIAPGGE